jgi:sulfide dehydrogenase [flavocytochrome c] flavoprotein subunit
MKRIKDPVANKISRRNFLKTSTGAAVGAAAAGLVTGSAGSAKAAGPTLVFGLEADIPPVDKGTLRTIVVGGGWGGLTMAKHLKLHAPDMDVVLIEKRAVFFSCPVSNLWLADLVTYDFLTHSFVDAARNNKYTFFNATVVDVDREKRRLYTEQGYVDYDYLVLSPGIDYDYDDIGVHVPEEQYLLAQTYPAAFKPGSEHITLKRKVDEFERGLFALTVPSGNYRCLPAPYERACMIASVFKRKKIPAKVLLLDDSHDIKIKGEGFHAAFDELYKDYIEYYTSVDIAQVSVEKKTIIGMFDDFQFDDAAIYPRIRGARLIETLGLVSETSPQKEARINQYRNNYVYDKRVYIIGDSRSTGYSKSGSTAQAEARFVAKVIVERTKGNEIEWESPYTSCYSMVNAEPAEAIYFGSEYLPPQADITAAAMELTIRMWLDSGAAFAWRDRNMNRSAEMGGLMIDWATSHYQEMFG